MTKVDEKVNPAAAPHKDQHVGAGSRGLLGHDAGAFLITLAAFLSFVLSVVLWFTDSRQEALFTGLWVPSILALGGFYAALRGRQG